MILPKVSYYDHPEGEDIVGKMMATNTYAALTGLAWSTLDVLLITHPKGYLPTLGRYMYHIGPFMGMASAFTLTTYAATNLRGKDDRINYFLGGMAAGGVYGAWKTSHVKGLTIGIFFGLAGTLKKLSKIEGWEFFPSVRQRSYVGLKDRDYTIMKSPPKNWSTAPDNSPN